MTGDLHTSADLSNPVNPGRKPLGPLRIARIGFGFLALVVVLGVAGGLFHLEQDMRSTSSMTSSGSSLTGVTETSAGLEGYRRFGIIAPAGLAGRGLGEQVAALLVSEFGKKSIPALLHVERSGNGWASWRDTASNVLAVYPSRAASAKAGCDAFITIGVSKWSYSPFPFSRHYEADLQVNMTADRGVHIFKPKDMARLDSLQISHRMQIQGNMRGLFNTGYLTRSVAADCAKSAADTIAKTIGDQFEDVRKKIGEKTD